MILHYRATKAVTTTTSLTTTAPMLMKSIEPEKSPSRKRNERHLQQQSNPKVCKLEPWGQWGTLKPSSILASVRQASNSDSDSDYEARAHKKKKKSRTSGDEVRVSSRGVKVPNYVDDVQDFEKFEEQEPDDNGYYVDPNQHYQEEDEIEAVLGHSREEGREDDPEDLWFENLVCLFHYLIFSYSKVLAALSYQMEKLFASS
jgi:chromodomain-helicase-DNA-binding protein 1